MVCSSARLRQSTRPCALAVATGNVHVCACVFARVRTLQNLEPFNLRATAATAATVCECTHMRRDTYEVISDRIARSHTHTHAYASDDLHSWCTSMCRVHYECASAQLNKTLRQAGWQATTTTTATKSRPGTHLGPCLHTHTHIHTLALAHVDIFHLPGLSVAVNLRSRPPASGSAPPPLWRCPTCPGYT